MRPVMGSSSCGESAQKMSSYKVMRYFLQPIVAHCVSQAHAFALGAQGKNRGWCGPAGGRAPVVAGRSPRAPNWHGDARACRHLHVGGATPAGLATGHTRKSRKIGVAAAPAPGGAGEPLKPRHLAQKIALAEVHAVVAQ